jgi:hypothetical protein
VVKGGCDAPASSERWQLLSSEDGNTLREVCHAIFGGEFDSRMAHIEVCLAFSSSVRREDTILLRFTASVHAPPFKDPSHPRYDELKIECRRLRRVDADGSKTGTGREGYKLI